MTEVNLFDFIDTVTEGSVPGKETCRGARRRLEQIIDEKKQLKEIITKLLRSIDSCNHCIAKIKSGDRDYWKQFFSSWDRLSRFAQKLSGDLFLSVED